MNKGNKHFDSGTKYEKPCLRVIELAADEVLGTACKTRSGSGGQGGQCFIQNCKQKLGS